jgi:hypothetical protein
MTLPNYIRMDDLLDRFDDAMYYRTYNIPLSVKRENEAWCYFCYLADISGVKCEHKLFKIRLPKEGQLESVKALLEEYCDKYQIPYT